MYFFVMTETLFILGEVADGVVPMGEFINVFLHASKKIKELFNAPLKFFIFKNFG